MTPNTPPKTRRPRQQQAARQSITIRDETGRPAATVEATTNTGAIDTEPGWKVKTATVTIQLERDK
jgi:hypothetical protein